MNARPNTRIERVAVIFVLLFFAGGAVIFRLFEKQVMEHGQYAQASESQSTGESTIPASRGKIFAKDRDKSLVHLAVSEWRYDLVVSPRQVKNKKTLSEELSRVYPALTAPAILELIDNDKVYIPPIAKSLSTDEAEKVKKEGFAGVFAVPRLVRVYPEGAAIAAQALGFVGADGEGKYGVESIYDAILRGQAGVETQKQDSLGRLIDILSAKQSEAGADLVLTLDYNLQFVAETKLKEALEKYKAESGSIVVMEPKTGAILALAGQPTFDPNTYSTLRGIEQTRFLVPAISDVYEPGSVMKPITMSVALDMGVVAPETTETFGKSVTILGETIMNAEEEAFGRENMTQVLENSDNIAMVWLSEKIGAKTEREFFEKYGFGVESEIDLVGEQAGRLPPEKEWNDLLRSTAAFGQGVSVNVVQLAAAYSVIANGGSLVRPHVAEKVIQGSKVTALDFPSRHQVIKSETAKQVREMLSSVVVNGHGKRAAIQGVRVGGKTGTAEVPNPAGGYHEDQHIGTFAGLFPVDDPKFVMVVRLNDPKTVKFAESSAAPTFGEIANWMATYFQLR